ncbi:hypothetical protein C2E20_7702 [Micractinium conductrix]|uniref:Uncharacterized protein n=1 Tax=Micractinium conductrix TaxID=554055 RepID=A0A2P6V3Q0_9CHLO|nr:hypothetical protein C2E20_7702 [Micractinium conductrix]|eukprot:PSC68722.1 hypothetical protein C2E20_7702 [Micractinium conductrix]
MTRQASSSSSPSPRWPGERRAAGARTWRRRCCTRRAHRPGRDSCTRCCSGPALRCW